MTGDDSANARRKLASILDDLSGAYEQVRNQVAAILDSIEDPQQAFEAATELAAKLKALHNREDARFGRLRAQQAVRIREADALSLSRLADRLSMSKARADQLIRAAKKEG